LASSAPIHCVRTWHHDSYAVYPHPPDKSLKRNNNAATAAADGDNNNENKPENKEGE
jgi:hypothetical protein